MSNEMYKQVTDRIIAELEKGAAPWVKQWSARKAAGIQSADHNLVSGKSYTGINRVILGMSGFQSSTWATFKQWKEKGASVMKGQKGTHIVFFKPVSKTETDAAGNETTKSFAIMKSYVVFNADQVQGYEAPVATPVATPELNEAAQALINNSGAIIHHGGDRAFYAPSIDAIQLPTMESFDTVAAYYATAFHELTHWTGSDKRLDRVFGQRFGDPKYAFEELVAELGAAFLCAEAGVDGDLRHAGYIESWLKALRDDETAIFKASALAQKAADFITSAEAQDNIEELAAA